jgi:hypothetical protein
LSNVFFVISKRAFNGEFCASLSIRFVLRNVVVVVVVVADVVDFVNNKELGRNGIGHNGCVKYRRRSIGFVKNISLLSLLSSDDVDSQFSERISLIKNDFDVDDDIGNNS